MLSGALLSKCELPIGMRIIFQGSIREDESVIRGTTDCRGGRSKKIYFSETMSNRGANASTLITAVARRILTNVRFARFQGRVDNPCDGAAARSAATIQEAPLEEGI